VKFLVTKEFAFTGGELFTKWKLVAVLVMVRIYTSVRVQLLQTGTDSVRRITDFPSDRVENVRVFLVLCADKLAVELREWGKLRW
jgi:hypothetical protein